MAEYMNKSLVLAGLNLRLLRLKNEHENVDKIAELENIICAISETETEDVIERSKIDKAIEYIMQYSSMQANPYKREGMRRAIELLKQKIGEWACAKDLN